MKAQGTSERGHFYGLLLLHEELHLVPPLAGPLSLPDGSTYLILHFLDPRKLFAQFG